MEPDGLIEWPPAVTEKFWKVCKHCMNLRNTKILEQRLRQGTGTESMLGIESCGCHTERSSEQSSDATQVQDANSHLGYYCLKKHTNDKIGEAIQRLTMKNVFIEFFMVGVAERAAELVESMHKKLLNDRNSISKKELAIQQEVVLTRVIQDLLVKEFYEDRVCSKGLEAKDGGLLAYPSSYRKCCPNSPFIGLDAIDAENMELLMHGKLAVIHPWLPAAEDVRAFEKDYQWLEMNSSFANQSAGSIGKAVRTDMALWMSKAHIPEKLQLKGLSIYFDKTTSLPFELNAKTRMKLTVANEAFLSLFKPGAYYDWHCDNVPTSGNSEGRLDNGKTITALFCVDLNEGIDGNEDKDLSLCLEFRSNNATQLNNHDKNKSFWRVNPKTNSLILFRTRELSYRIKPVTTKSAIAFYWCHGPSII